MPSTLSLPPKRLKVIVQGQIVIPDWVDDLETFCDWRLAEETPSRGEIAFLDTSIWVDLSMEEFFTHNQVKAAFDFAIMSVVRATNQGRYVPDRMLLKSAKANLSAEPDGLFCTWESLKSQRLRLVDKPGQGIMELEGSPDLVLEIVSKTSVEKDTLLLRDLYWKAGISEYWLVDVRDGKLSFDILQTTPEGFVATAAAEGWISSKVLGKRFQLHQEADPLGHPLYVVNSKD